MRRKTTPRTIEALRPRWTLVVLLKTPAAGRTKTRLGRAIGAGRAAALARAMSAATIAEAEKCGARLILAIDPLTDVFSKAWPAQIKRIAQASGDLGMRMRAALRALPGGPIVFIGADAPALRASHLRAAFRALGSNDAVFGPAADGGYWLVGLARRRRSPNAFSDVCWSSADALRDTIESLPSGFSIALLPVLQDVDDAADLATAGPFMRSQSCGGPAARRRTQLTRRRRAAHSRRRR